MGRDWSILAVKLNLTEQLPEVDSSGQSLSRTDQLLAEWALRQPEDATVGQLCQILTELGRKDAVEALYRTVPLYLFANGPPQTEENPQGDGTHPHHGGSPEADSGVASSNHSHNSGAVSDGGGSTLSR